MFIEMLAENCGLISIDEGTVDLNNDGRKTKLNYFNDDGKPHGPRSKVMLPGRNDHSSKSIPINFNTKKLDYGHIVGDCKDIKRPDLEFAGGFTIFALDEIESAYRNKPLPKDYMQKLANLYSKADDKFIDKCIDVSKGKLKYDQIKNDIEEVKKGAD